MYNWESAKRACPEGWHLPLKEEFDSLLIILGGNGKNAYLSLITNGKSGFSSQFSGWRKDYGEYTGINETADYWSATEDKKGFAWNLDVYKPEKSANIYNNYIELGLSVRCLKD